MENDQVIIILEDLRSQFKAFGESLQLIARKVDRLELKVDKIEEDINIMKSDIVTMKGNINETKDDIVVMKNDIEILKSDMNIVKSDLLSNRNNSKNKVSLERFEELEKKVFHLEKLVIT